MTKTKVIHLDYILEAVSEYWKTRGDGNNRIQWDYATKELINILAEVGIKTTTIVDDAEFE